MCKLKNLSHERIAKMGKNLAVERSGQVPRNVVVRLKVRRVSGDPQCNRTAVCLNSCLCFSVNKIVG